MSPGVQAEVGMGSCTVEGSKGYAGRGADTTQLVQLPPLPTKKLGRSPGRAGRGRHLLTAPLLPKPEFSKQEIAQWVENILVHV